MKEKHDGSKALADAAKAYMEEHSAEHFSLEAMAGALYVNGSHLLRTFKRCTGMTPLAYHHMLRCSRAKELLAETAKSVSEVGEAVGFVSASHFSHIFRKTEGCTPSEYRRAHQAGENGEADA